MSKPTTHDLRLTFALLIIGFLAVPLLASAQPTYSNPDLKSVSTARGKAVRGVIFPVGLGVGSTLIFENNTVELLGSSLAVYGLMVGPSIGNFYARDYVRGFIGVAARLAGGYLIRDATREIFGDDMADAVGWDDEKVSLTDTKILIGGGLILGSALYNIISAEASVERYNSRRNYYVSLFPVIHKGKVMPFISARFNF